MSFHTSCNDIVPTNDHNKDLPSRPCLIFITFSIPFNTFLILPTAHCQIRFPNFNFVPRRTTPNMSPALPRMTPRDFLGQLPEAQDLPDCDECPVCLQKYVSAKAPAPGIIERIFSMAARRDPEPIEPEHAVRLPCQHVLGSKCIKRWISRTEGDQNTCPYVSGFSELFMPLSQSFSVRSQV